MMPKRILRWRERLLNHWSEEDYPGGHPYFRLSLMLKDLVIFVVVPIGAVVFFKLVEGSTGVQRKGPAERREQAKDSEWKSQIIHFQDMNAGVAGVKKALGSLVRVRLLNVVETLSVTPVHAQIIDNGLGRDFLGGTLVGSAVPDTSLGRINIEFKFARYPNRSDVGLPIAGRALSLTGVFGLLAEKKEGVFARSAIRSASTSQVEVQSDGNDLKSLLMKALATNLVHETQADAAVTQARAQVLTLAPKTEFFVELTDNFPGQR